MPRVALHDVEIEYCREGHGDRLLVISGTGGDLRSAPNIFQSPLAAQFEILAYDQRGLGLTSIPPGPYSMADYANDAIGLLESLGWSHTHLLGTSFGGMVAQEVAIARPDLIDRLVLCCTSSGGAGGSSYPLQELAELPEAERGPAMFELADTRRDATWRAEYPGEFARLLEARSARLALSAGDPDRLRGARLQMEARAQHDTYERLGGIKAPTLVCGGRFDGIAVPSNLAALAAAIPGAELRYFEGGHPFLNEDLSAYPSIAAFLGATPPLPS